MEAPTDTSPLVEYLSAAQAAALLDRQVEELGATEFARVRNLEYVFAPFELYPLAPRTPLPLERIAAFAVDMDGTSTTTEPLALHALEYMVRRVTGWLDPARWPGLDRQRDYPFVIGSSNYRHTEFLLERYGTHVDQAALRQAFFEAVLWTLANLPDPRRRQEVVRNARNCGLGALLADPEFQRLCERGRVDFDDVARQAAPWAARFRDAFSCGHRSELVNAALEVYYMRYHGILQKIERGEGDRLAAELLGTGGRHLVEPMPGYAVFVALIKGWLGEDVDGVFDRLRGAVSTANGLDEALGRFRRLALHFQRHPVRLALVTASIAYEARAVMREVLRRMVREIQDWPISATKKEMMQGRCAEEHHVFEALVTASDAHEARLKPHRDLYSIALFQMAVPKSAYSCCVGLEDTEPGVVALRAAGFGGAIALPNRDTRAQNYAAASRVVRGGLPELILRHNLFLADPVLAAYG